MFGKLKDRLKSWFSKSKEKAAEQSEKEERKPSGKEEKLKKEKAAKTKKAKEEVKIEEKKEEISEERKEEKQREIKEERKISGEVLEDIKKEGLEIKTPEERVEERIKELEEEKALLEKAPGEKIAEREKEEEIEEKKGFFARLKGKFKFKITEEYFNSIFSELENVLLESNVALEVVEHLQGNLRKELVGLEIGKDKVEDEIRKALRISIDILFERPFDVIEKIKEKKKKGEPYVIVFFGINGSGKTTSIAKIANLLKEKKFSVVLAAGDTFRAASIEQLAIHADRLGVKIIKNQYGSDPASVGFDAIKHAKAHGIDVVLIDTAGRMHTKDSLMKEMEKIVRVTKPDLKIFIGESITGNDAIEQAKTFNEAIGIDGIILSKADVDEKGGTALSVSYITGKPILFLGVGQEYKDLKAFDKEDFLESLGL